MAKSKRRFTNFFYILVTLFLVLLSKVQSSEDVTRVRRRMVAMCPPGFQKIRTECYHISTQPLTWLEAHFECKSKNGKLAEPTRTQDAAIRKFLLNKYASERDPIYFGGMFDHHARKWSWGVTGQEFNYSSFIGLNTYKKHKTLDQTCTVYNPKRKFRWTPRDCTENHKFLCEHKMPKVSEKNKDKVYQRWNGTYPNQFANEVIMEVRDDDRHNNSGRVKVVSDSGEEFYMKRTPHTRRDSSHRNARLPMFSRPTYNTPTPQTKNPNDVLSDAGNSVDNNEILKPVKNPKKDRTRSKFDREVAKQRRLERSRQRAAKKEERQRRLREKEELKRQREQENERKNLELQKIREENERKRLQEERAREQEERRRLEDAARREEEERQRLEDAMRREENERHKLEDERRYNQDDSKRQKRLEMDLVGADFIPEVITEDYRAIEQKKLEKQKQVEELEKAIQEKYRKEQEAELAIQKMEQEKHIKELEEKELARHAEEQKHREERENERQRLIKEAEEMAKRIDLENKMMEERKKEEEEYQKRLEKEKAERLEQEQKEKERKIKEQREREEQERLRKAEIQKKIDAEKDDVIEEQMRNQEKLAIKNEVMLKWEKFTPEERKKYIELKKKAKKARLANKLKAANEVTRDDKK